MTDIYSNLLKLITSQHVEHTIILTSVLTLNKYLFFNFVCFFIRDS